MYVFFPLKTHGHSEEQEDGKSNRPRESRPQCRARSQGRTGTSDRRHPSSGAKCPTCRNWHPETRAPACEPGVPRAHGATCPTPPTQISTPSPKSSCAPSREPCSATRCLWSIRGTRTRGAPFCRTFERNGAKDPLTRRALSSTKVMTNWAMRNVVQAWLDKHPGVTPDGWDSRELLEPSKDDGTRTFDDEGDVGVLRTWRAMCPELQALWPEAARPEDWEGVTIENGRVVKLVLEDFGLTGAVPAEVGRLSALRELHLNSNQLTSLPAEIGQLTALSELNLESNQLTSLPAEIGQLTSLRGCDLERKSADELAGGDRAAHRAGGVAPQPQSADELAGCDTRAHSGGLRCVSGSRRDV